MRLRKKIGAVVFRSRVVQGQLLVEGVEYGSRFDLMEGRMVFSDRTPRHIRKLLFLRTLGRLELAYTIQCATGMWPAWARAQFFGDVVEFRNTAYDLSRPDPILNPQPFSGDGPV